MEIKIDIEKDNVTKSVPENLISDYEHMGWKRVKRLEKKEKNFEEESPRISFKKNLKD